jgi:hypothetical protein
VCNWCFAERKKIQWLKVKIRLKTASKISPKQKESRTMTDSTQADLDNHANQIDPNNDEDTNGRNSCDDAPSDGEFEWMPDNGD